MTDMNVQTLAPTAAEDEKAQTLVDTHGQELKSELPPEKDWSKAPFPIELFENRIGIKRDDREELTEGGLILPPGARQKTMTGIVVAIGPGMKKSDGSFVPLMGSPEPIKIGDRVVFEKFRQMIEVFVEGRTYHITRDSDMLGRAQTGTKVRQGRI